jgi:hypothetical protein
MRWPFFPVGQGQAELGENLIVRDRLVVPKPFGCFRNRFLASFSLLPSILKPRDAVLVRMGDSAWLSTLPGIIGALG